MITMNKMDGKIGLGVVTYNRPDYLRQCLEALEKNNWGGANYIIVIDDSSSTKNRQLIERLEEKYEDELGIVTFLYKIDNKGVANSKNVVFNEFGQCCEHIFIIEDDILMQHPDTCKLYIDYAKMVGVKHLNFALHGPMNIDMKSNHLGTCVYPNCVGAFSYYHKDCIDKVGYFDENFYNAFEHVYHTYKIAKAGLTTPFWYFADHPMSDKLLKEIPGSIDNSSIRTSEDWQDNIDKAKQHWIKKEGSWLPPRPY